MDDLIPIKIFLSKIEAEIAKSYLASEGINAFLQSDDVGSMYPSTQSVSGVRLFVKAADAQRAKEMLQDY